MMRTPQFESLHDPHNHPEIGTREAGGYLALAGIHRDFQLQMAAYYCKRQTPADDQLSYDLYQVTPATQQEMEQLDNLSMLTPQDWNRRLAYFFQVAAIILHERIGTFERAVEEQFRFVGGCSAYLQAMQRDQRLKYAGDGDMLLIVHYFLRRLIDEFEGAVEAQYPVHM